MRTPARPAPSAPPSRKHRRRTLASALLVGALGLGALAGCGAGSSGDSAAVGGRSGAVEQSDAQAPVAAGGAEQPATPFEGSKQAGTNAVVAVSDRKLSRRADMSLTVTDVPLSAAKVRGVAASQNGVVVAEEVSTQKDAPEGDGFAYGTITISVPADRLDAALDEVAKIGEVASRNTSTDDVTAQFVDTESRVKSMKASVERVRALMTRAEKLTDIVALESELSRRQSDLEAYETQLAALQDSVTLSPITVRLATSEKELAEQGGDTGFLAGLTAGWKAFTGSVTVLLTALGAVLPFAVFIALVLVPLVLWLRRRTPHAQAPAATPAAFQPPPAV